MTNTAIIGLGNLLLGDEGLGIKAVQELTEEAPDNVSVIDGGTPGFRLLNSFEEYEKVIIIDAVKMQKEKGDIVEFKVNKAPDIEKLSLSAHDIDFLDALAVGEEMEILPEIKVYGIEIGKVDRTNYTMELSKEIKEKLPKLIEKVLSEVKNESNPQKTHNN
ncbi:MAG: NiFe-hydrogenase maturation factor [Candidatus Methanohalarchaeum thermophilum]|uniref:NiFe-hydrogenase maturation factor n=1 Tax=Methanohalarchaeum thermophilum TaxID=1903181 RepID=A0A1Q6DS08_METT1|nr:MAG: NiFe-hydrogenase maturation factor [Candidatus Methanohalarchaeum thermophilum]